MNDFYPPGSVERSVATMEMMALLHRYAVMARADVAWEKLGLLFRSDGVFRLSNAIVVSLNQMFKVAQSGGPKYITYHMTSADICFVGLNEARNDTLFFTIADTSPSTTRACR